VLLSKGVILVLLLTAEESPDFIQPEILAGQIHEVIILIPFDELSELGNQFKDIGFARTSEAGCCSDAVFFG